MLASMKSAWRKVTRGAAMPTGKPPFSSASAASTCRVSATVSAAGCFCTDRITAGWPLSPASPRLIAGAKPTDATCASRIGWPLRAVSGRRCRSSSRLVRPRLRIRYSRELSSRKPPLVLAAKPRSASSTWPSVMPSAAMRTVSGCTWNCRTSPPIGMTWATPGIVRRRGRSTQSAYSRAAIAGRWAASGALSVGAAAGAAIGIPMSRISPMIDATGPMCGTTPGGSCDWISDRRSAIICRAR